MSRSSTAANLSAESCSCIKIQIDAPRPAASAADPARVEFTRSSEASRRQPQPGQGKHRDGEARHLRLLSGGLVVPTQEVQQPMDGQEAQLGLLRLTELARLPDNHRPRDGEVSKVLVSPGK